MKNLTKRRINKLNRKERDKQVRKISDEYNDTSGWNTPYIELDEPLRRGFKRTLELTHSATKRHDVKILEKLRGLISKTYYKNNRNFKNYDNVTGRYTAEFVHEIRGLDQKDYDKLDVIEKTYFDGKWRTTRWGSSYFSYHFSEPNLFESRMSKWFVTRVPMLDPDRISRHSELFGLLHGPSYLVTDVDRIYSHSYNYHRRYEDGDSFYHRVNKLEMKELNYLLSEEHFMDDLF